MQASAYRAQYQLAALRRAADTEFCAVDVLLLPTAATNYEISAVAAEPSRINTDLGLYTNFVNLLDLATIALPAGFSASGLVLWNIFGRTCPSRRCAARPRNALSGDRPIAIGR